MDCERKGGPEKGRPQRRDWEVLEVVVIVLVYKIGIEKVTL